MGKDFVHPYMPNSVPEIKQEMLQELGVESIEDIYKSVIPEELLYKERLDLPEPILSEHALKKHVMGILKRMFLQRNIPVFWVQAATSTRCRPCVMRSTPEESS